MSYTSGNEDITGWLSLCIWKFFYSEMYVLLELVGLAAKFSCPELIQSVVKLYLSADDLTCAPHLHLNLL